MIAEIIKNSAYSFITKIFIIFLLGLAVFIPQPLFEKYIILISIFLFFIFLLLSKAVIKNTDYPDIFLFAFMGIVSFGLVYSQNMEIAVKRYFLTYLPLVLIYIISKNLHKDSYIFLIRLIVFIGGLISIFIIFEFFTKKNFIYQHIWRNVYFNVPFYKNRAFGTFYHPTITGSFLNMCLPFIWLYLHDKRKRINLILGSIIFISVSVAIVATLSKIAFIVMLFIYLWYSRQKNTYINKLLLVTLLILMIAIFLKSAVLINKFSPYFMVTAVTYRLKSLCVAIKMINEHPFLGVGLDHFRLLYLNYINEPNVPYVVRIPDNMYLTILTETGVISFIFFMAFILLLIKRVVKKLRKMEDDSEKVLIEALLVSFIGALVYNFTYDSFYWSTPLIIFWMLAGMLANLSKPKGP